MMEKVHVLNHPLLQHKLSILRNKDTGVKEFREIVGEIAALMCYEATRDLPTEEITVETPVAPAKCRVLSGKKLAIVPILRAGLGMVDTIVDLIPSAKIGHIGLFRDPETHEPVKYYCKMPPTLQSGGYLWWILCWPPAALLPMPLPLSRNTAAKILP